MLSDSKSFFPLARMTVNSSTDALIVQQRGHECFADFFRASIDAALLSNLPQYERQWIAETRRGGGKNKKSAKNANKLCYDTPDAAWALAYGKTNAKRTAIVRCETLQGASWSWNWHIFHFGELTSLSDSRRLFNQKLHRKLTSWEMRVDSCYRLSGRNFYRLCGKIPNGVECQSCSELFRRKNFPPRG